MNNESLISIVVITYNSSKYILETLESIKIQTFQNIELIISDDCSKDNTVAICKEWISANSNSFVRTQIVTTSVNTGIAANCNRGLNVTEGSWIKFIAGDDILLPNCIELNHNFILQNNEIKILFSKVLGINQQNINIDLEKHFKYPLFKLSKKDFQIRIALSNFIPAPTAFISREVYETIGGFDENIPMMEDWPFWVKAAVNNYTFYYMPCQTVKYRIHDQSISLGTKSEKYKESELLARKKVLVYKKKINFMLWIDGAMREKTHLRCFRIFNPYFYYLKYHLHKWNRMR
ncbi:MAG: glycosyltransferase [Phocaeicola sp.]